MAIVCGTDFSAASDAARVAAAALASRNPGAELWLAHVTDPAIAAGDTATARQQLAAEAARLRSLTTAVVREHLLSGDVAADALVSFADAHDATLLVVASRGHSAGPVYRLGSTAERVAHAAEIPTLVVPDGAAFAAWGRGDRPLRVLVGIDDSASSAPAVRWVKELRQSGACDVTVGSIYYAADAAQRYGRPAPASFVEPDPETERLLARDLAAQVGDIPGEGSVTFRPQLGIGRTGDHLLALADSIGADVIVVGTHHRQGLARISSVASVVLHFATGAVACVPLRDDATAASADALPRITRVLVATDLSPFSSAALPHAYGLVADHGGEVHLLHVTDQPAEEHERIAAQLRAMVPAAAHSAAIVTRTAVIHSATPASVICETAERIAADVVCLASHGRSGLLRAVVGSVAEAVLRQSRRPVFVIRPPAS